MGYVGWTTVTICCLAGVTLFFSVNGIALRTFSPVRLQDALKTSRRRQPAQIVTMLTENAERLILTCSLYRLIFNMCILILLINAFAIWRQVHPSAIDFLSSAAIATTIFSIFSVAIPHAWAKYAGEKFLAATYRLLLLFAFVTAPILYTFRLYDGLVRRLAGVTRTSPEERLEEKQEEFLTELEQHRMEGAVDKEEQQMIENVLELSETTVDQVMTPRTDLIAVRVDSDLKTVLDAVTKAGLSRVPVYEGTIDNIIGILYTKDLLTEIGKEPAGFKIKDKMRQAYFVPETKPVRALLHEFQNQKLQIAVVLDEYGGTAGIVTLEDILEELVGDIADEYKRTSAESIKKIDENTIEVDARTYIDDLNDRFKLSLPDEEDYDTVAGFVFSRVGYIPKAGEEFQYANLKFIVTSAEPRRIKRIRIQFPRSGTQT